MSVCIREALQTHPSPRFFYQKKWIGFNCRLISNFSACLEQYLDGNGDTIIEGELIVGAQINNKFKTEFPKILAVFPESASFLTDEISIAVANAHGCRNPLFVPEKAFHQIIRNLLAHYEDPLTSCVKIVKTELEKALKKSLEVLKCYPVMREEVDSLVSKQLKAGEADAISQLHNFLDAQKSFMNTRHPDFTVSKVDILCPSMSSSEQKSIGFSPTRRAPSPPVDDHDSTSEKERHDPDEKEILQSHAIQEQSRSLKRMVVDYMKIRHTIIEDFAPMSIMHQLVDSLLAYIKDQLFLDIQQKQEADMSTQRSLVCTYLT